MPRGKGGNIAPAPSPVEAAHTPVGGAGTPAGAAAPISSSAPPAPQGAAPQPRVPAGAMGRLDAPTNRPQEPITAGLSEAARGRAMMAGAGPQAGPDLDAAVRALYSLYPHPHLLELLR